MKPEPEIYELTARRLAVRPEEVALPVDGGLDDQPGHVEAARAAGWRAVVHVETGRSIEEIEAILAGHTG